MKRILSLLPIILAAAIFVTSAFDAAADAPPEFKLGFKAFADQIPEVVGQPVENEHYARNGDSIQRTTNGMMVWRKADNWTAFTDGYKTWVNGPNGVQERLNDQKFDWEATQPKPQPLLTCANPNVVKGADIFENTIWINGEVGNEGDAPAFDIEVTVKLLDASGAVVRTDNTYIDFLGSGDVTAYQITIKNPGSYANVEITGTGKDASSREFEKLDAGRGTLGKINDEYGGDIFNYSGSVVNPTDTQLRYCKAIVWFLDAQNKIVWVDTAFTNPGDLAPKASGSVEKRTFAQRFIPGISNITQVKIYGWGAK